MSELLDRDLVDLARAAEAASRPEEADPRPADPPRSSGRAGIALPAAGWYTDPRDPLQRRWWDGSQWTGHVRPVVANPVRFQPVSTQAGRVDTRSSIRELAAGMRAGEPVSRFAPGAPQTAVVPARAAVTWPQSPAHNPAARASLVAGLLSVVLPVIIPSILAFVLGGIGLGRAGSGALAVGRRQASWGIALGIVGLAITTAVTGFLLTNPAFLAWIGVTSG